MCHLVSAIALFVLAGSAYGSSIHHKERARHDERTYLVTMTKEELLDTINCVSFAEDTALCAKFEECIKKKPDQVLEALDKCERQIVKGGKGSCKPGSPYYASRAIPSKIYECIVANTFKLSAQEQKRMVEFEECARRLSDSCKSKKHHY